MCVVAKGRGGECCDRGPEGYIPVILTNRRPLVCSLSLQL